MFYGIAVFIFCTFLAVEIAKYYSEKYRIVSSSRLMYLYFYHFFIWNAYYLYALSNPSDSNKYYFVAETSFRGDSWSDYYGVSTPFIEFLSFPLVQYFGFSYEAIMVFFGFLGFLGILYLYIFFVENIRFKHQILGFDLVTILFFLPNSHFWSVSLGKGSTIFLGIGLLFYGLSKIGTRWGALIIGSLIIYHVRPHVMFIIIIAGVMGLLTSSARINASQRIAILLIGIGVFIAIYQPVLDMTGLEEDWLIEGEFLSNRAEELSKGATTSAVDISNYSLPMKLLSFWFRPLFFDAPGILGLIVSTENFIYIVLIVLFIRLNFLTYLWQSDFLAKTAFLTFIGFSIPLSQISGNMGLALRQKSMVMLLFFFVMLYYLDAKKWKRFKKRISLAGRGGRIKTLPLKSLTHK